MICKATDDIVVLAAHHIVWKISGIWPLKPLAALQKYKNKCSAITGIVCTSHTGYLISYKTEAAGVSSSSKWSLDQHFISFKSDEDIISRDFK